MKAEELRIGNIIDYGEDNPQPLTLKMLSNICNDTQDDTFKPIPLTEEWLVKFGLVQDKKSWLFKSHVVGKYHLNLKAFITGFKIGNVKCEYIHDLQNLYHAITGEELIIKE